MIDTQSIKIAKEAAGKAAANLVESGMLIGLGTGSTAAYFIEHLIKRRRQGLDIRVVSSSKKSTELARAGGIPFANIEEITSIDLTVDGADEIDRFKRMTKGGGGALLQEKILASMSHEVVIVIDADKQVEILGAFPLPVEIVPFAYRATLNHLERLGYHAVLRKTVDETLFMTDNRNYIVDIHWKHLCDNPEYEDRRIRSIPGVVETGFFFNLAGRIIVGFPDGHVEIRS